MAKNKSLWEQLREQEASDSKKLNKESKKQWSAQDMMRDQYGVGVQRAAPALVMDFIRGVEPTIGGKFNVGSIPQTIQGLVNPRARQEIIRRGQTGQRQLDLGEKSSRMENQSRELQNRIAQMQAGEMEQLQQGNRPLVPISEAGSAAAERDARMEMLKTGIIGQLLANPEAMLILTSPQIDERARSALMAMLKPMLPKGLSSGDMNDFIDGLRGGMGTGGGGAGTAASIDAEAGQALGPVTQSPTGTASRIPESTVPGLGAGGGGVQGELQNLYGLTGAIGRYLTQGPQWNRQPRGPEAYSGGMTPEMLQAMQDFISPSPRPPAPGGASLDEIREIIRQLRTNQLPGGM